MLHVVTSAPVTPPPITAAMSTRIATSIQKFCTSKPYAGRSGGGRLPYIGGKDREGEIRRGEGLVGGAVLVPECT